MTREEQEKEAEYLSHLTTQEMERTLLLATLNDLDGRLWPKLSALSSDDFRDPVAHRIYLAMHGRYREAQKVDFLGVYFYLSTSTTQQDLDAAQTLQHELESNRNQVLFESEFKMMFGEIKRQSVHRRVSANMTFIQDQMKRKRLSGTQLRELVTAAMERAFGGYTEDRLGLSEKECWRTMAEEAFDREQGGSVVGQRYPFGFPGLDELCPGLARGMVVQIVGRSGMGKSAFALQLARNIARHGLVLWISFEMKWREVCARIIAQELGCPWAQVPASRLLDAAETRARNLYIDDTWYSSADQLRRAVKLFKLAHPDLLAIGIDYGQQLARRDPVPQAEASATIKRIAHEENLGVMVVLQAATDVDQRKDQRPTSGDIRYGKGWEQDADVQLGLFRPSYYDKDLRDRAGAECIVMKQRDGGPTGTAYLRFNGPITHFHDADAKPLTAEQISLFNQEQAQAVASVPDIF